METNGTNGTPMPESNSKVKSKGDAEGATPEPQPGDEPMPSETQPAAPSRQELEDKQLDIALEAREIEKALAQLPKATDLAKERMAATAKSAEDAAAALGRGEMEEARGAAGTTREQLRELVDQVEALLAEEQADRIAAAQQMANNLARMQQDFVDRLSNPGEGPGQGNPRPPEDQENRQGAGKAQGKKAQENEEPMPGAGQGQGESDDEQQGLGGAAEEIARKAETLADVLGAAARGDAPEELESAGKVADLVNALDLSSLTDRLKNLPGQVENDQLEDARNAAGDGAERMELAAEELGNLHRTIVAPQVAELAKLEQQLTALDEELNQLETDTNITGWHMEATELLDELAEAGIDEETRKEFLEEMKKAGWGDGVRRNWNWGRIEGGYYAAPPAYRALLSRLSASLRTRMQEYLLGDLRSTGDEPIPPQYEELVDRYYEVLSASGPGNAAPQSGAATK
jgi:hypothetical protein